MKIAVDLSTIVVDWCNALWVIEVDYHSRFTFEFLGTIIVDYCSQSPLYGMMVVNYCSRLPHCLMGN